MGSLIMKTFARRKKSRNINRLSLMSSLCVALIIDRVNSQPKNLPSSSSTVVLLTCKESKIPVCDSWCHNHPLPWKDKCQWSNSCGGCSACGGCKVWCAENDTPWKDPNNDLNGNVKCNWISTCGSCPECISYHKPTFSPSSFSTQTPSFTPSLSSLKPTSSPSSFPTQTPSVTPSPPPTKGCKSWCDKHSTPWTEKCYWPINCGGCPQCVNHPTVSPIAVKHPSSALSQEPTKISPTPVPTTRKGCKRWCKRHPAPWTSSNQAERQKCKWYINCGGCPECK